VARFHGHLDQPQHSGVERFVQVGHVLVGPVDSDAVLNQVVGSDAEEIHLPGQQVRNGHRRRDLDHDPHGHVFVVGDAFPAKVLPDLPQYPAGFEELGHPGNEGKHQANVFRRGARSKNRPQLGLEKIPVMKTQANGSKPEGGVGFLHLGVPGPQLVRSEIQGPHGDPVGSHQLGQFPVVAVESAFVREVLSVDQEELRAIETDPFRSVVLGGNHFFKELDVGLHSNQVPVPGPGGEVSGAGDALLVLLQLDLALVIGADFLVGGIDDDGSRGAVQDHEASRRNGLGGPFGSHHRGNVQGSRQDGGMGGASSHIGNESQGLFQEQLGRVRGGEVVGNEDHPFADAVEEVFLLARQVAKNPFSHCLDVGGAASHVLVLDGFEKLVGFEKGTLQGPLGIEPLLSNQSKGFAEDQGVSQDHLVDFEDPGVFLDHGEYPRLDLLQVLFRLVDGVLELLTFLLDAGLIFEGMVGNGNASLLHEVGFSNGNARRDADSFNDFGRWAHANYPRDALQTG